MAAQTPSLRSGIVDVLRLLSSAEQQLEYERRVPSISVPIELESIWFDDTYIPSSHAFKSYFFPEELEAMAVFNTYFIDQKELLPKCPDGIHSWLNTETWQGIMREAGRALATFDPESKFFELS